MKKILWLFSLFMFCSQFAFAAVFSINNLSYSEANRNYNFTLTATATSASPCTRYETYSVDYATADGTATAGSDYTATSGTLTKYYTSSSRTSGTCWTQTITVVVNEDTLYEPDETFYVNLSNASSNATIFDSQGIGTITNDDPAPSLSISSNVTHDEGNSGTTPYVFTITQDRVSAYDTSFYFSTADGTATLADNDYIGISNQLVTIPAGSTTATVTVLVNGDIKYEGQEYFRVTISNPTNATLGTYTRYGYINNDDVTNPILSISSNITQNEGNSGTTAYTFTIAQDKTVSYDTSFYFSTGDGTATLADNDYIGISNQLVTIPAGSTTATVTVLVNGDIKYETQEYFFVTIFNPTNATLGTSTRYGYINNDDVTNPVLSISSDITHSEGNSGTTSYTFTIAQDKTVSYDTSFYFSTGDGTATLADNDYIGISNQLVTIPAGSTTATVTVLVNGDIKYEVQEYFRVTISTPTNATLGTSIRYGYIANDDTLPSLSIADANLTEGNTSYSNMNFIVTISKAADASVNYATSNGTATAGSDYDAVGGTLIFRATDTNLSKTILVPIEGDSLVENNETFTVTLFNEVNATLARATATGTIINDDKSYCSTNNLSTGFHVVNPFNDVNKSIEIFCSNNRDFIALPNKNNSNNFVFSSNILGSTNYYNEASSADTSGLSFQAIEINAYTLDVIVDPSLKTPQTVSTFKTMGSSFSNINLTATPFAIDWDNTTISDCNQSKLRTAYYGQDVKINSLDYDNKAICTINKMKLKLLDDYRYLEYNGNEVLQKSCKTIAENVPESFLSSSSIQGHYWISPFSTSRSYNSTDITSDKRPIITYCWYQTDLNMVWTFSLAMDGKVTNKKSDLVNKLDTCSKFGLLPFVANSENTFDRVRAFLTAKKSQWVNYTGTNNEKFRMFNNSDYYLGTEYNGVIWPYGSFGVYFPYAGDHLANGTSHEWGGSQKTPDYMSGSPMHNIGSITTDYDRFNDGANRNYYSWGHYSSTDSITATNQYTYADTMGAKGWVSILGAGDLNKTNEWFISRTGAGDNFDSTGNWPYYEPNGNYTAGAWVNFLFDSVGRVRHLDDLDAAYSYYDYMCMAEDNYDFTTRYTLVAGPFNAIEHSTASGREAIDTALTTKIVNDTLRFDILLLNDSMTALATDKNVSVGIFLDDDNGGTSRDLYYFGDIKKDGTGTFNALKTTGRFELPASAWPSGISTWPKANKSLFFHFKYCAISDAAVKEWTDCWTLSNNAATCKTGYESYCAHAESLNDFALRPDKFDVDITGISPYKAGKPYNVTFYARDHANNNTMNYNEHIPLTPKETMTGCITGEYDTNLSNLAFIDGMKNIPSLSYSEVGVINIKIEETSGSEFAVTDASDTPDSQRYITKYDHNVTYTPDHFAITDINLTNYNDGNFTYIANDLNMSSELNVTIIAQAENNTTTQNYNSTCYAKATDYNISYNALNVSPANALNNINFLEINTLKQGTSLINTPLNLADVNKTIFGTGIHDVNGTAKLSFKLNFDRNITQASNPIKITLRDFNITDDDNITGTTDINKSSPFYYGRVYSTDYRGSGIIPTTIRYEVYCNNDCNASAFPAIGTQSPTSLSWYQNRFHVIADGNVTTFTALGNTNIANSNISTINNMGEVDSSHPLSLPAGTIAPYTDRIQMRPATSLWLLYNPFNTLATTNDFNVEFISTGNWAGQGQLGETVDVNTSVRTNRRMEW